MPMCASLGFEYPPASSFDLVRILNSDVLPTCGRPMIPVFMFVLLQERTAAQEEPSSVNGRVTNQERTKAAITAALVYCEYELCMGCAIRAEARRLRVQPGF